jgi:hypothetical protein
MRPVTPPATAGGAATHRRIPVAFRLAAIRFLGHPVPAGEFRVPHGLPTSTAMVPDPDGVSTFRMDEIRPGWVPSLPRGHGAHTTGKPRPAATAASQRQALRSSDTSHLPELSVTRRPRGFTHVHPSGLPLACNTRTERASLGFSLELRTPQSPAAHVKVGTDFGH